jgi:hypothetical protein
MPTKYQQTINKRTAEECSTAREVFLGRKKEEEKTEKSA